MDSLEVIPAEAKTAWKDALALCGNFDIYHLPEYHLLAKLSGEGDPYLFFFHYNERYAALPILIRPLANVQGLGNCDLFDATSVYGYPGIVTSIGQDNSDAEKFRVRFQAAIMEKLSQLFVVTLFSRTNPLFPTSWLFKGLADIIPMASTIAIDLTAPEASQLRGMSKGHKYDIRKAYEMNVIVEEDCGLQRIEDFIQIYNQTMERVGANAYYCFTRNYYNILKDQLGSAVKLFIARSDNQIVSGSLFFATGKIIQYHLSGTPADLFRYNGAKAIIDYVRRWGTDKGFSCLHLGGGVGSTEDSLFRFKAGFSKVRYSFEIVRLVVNQQRYSSLIQNRMRWLDDKGYSNESSEYFPEYRRSIVKRLDGT